MIGYTSKKKEQRISSDINFQLSKGELMVIVGVNGIGKSTLLRTLAKVQRKLSGEIKIDKKELESYKAKELASILSVVLTEPIASKNMTVSELVALGRQPYTNWIGNLSETDKTKIIESIEMMGLEELKNKKCYELSDGQLQRVMIARALAQDTSVILLDEPTTHLDLHHKAHILKLLKSIAHKTKKAIVFTSHEIEMTIQLCDKMLVLERTKNSFGTPSDLVKEKVFNTLFPSKSISFNASTSKFQIKK